MNKKERMKGHIEQTASLYGFEVISIKEKKDGSIVIYLTKEGEDGSD